MDRLLIFGDNELVFPQVLLPKIHSLVKERGDITICGVVDTTKNILPSRSIRMIKIIASTLVKKIFNPGQKLNFGGYRFNNLSDICAKLHIQVIVPPKRDINDRGFVEFLRKSIRPTMGLAVGCLQVFKSDFLDLFDIFVNYHNGLLPAYSGLHATAWSVYFAEKYTGFTYHLVNEIIDGGNILLQDKIPIACGEREGDLNYLKTVKAAENIGRVLDQMIARDRGIPQGRKRAYFGKSKYEAITTIDDPRELTFAELERRLSAFGNLKIKILGASYPVTRIRAFRPASSRVSKLDFISKDHILVRPLRFQHLPFLFYKMYKFIKKLLHADKQMIKVVARRNESLPRAFPKVRGWLKIGLYRLSPALLYKTRFRLRKGHWPNLGAPRSFDEKLAFLMLYWRHPLKTFCTDKYCLRAYVQEHKLGHLLPELIGVYEDSREVDFAALPERFVLKCTHGWRFNIFCRDKRQLNFPDVRVQLDAWMRTDFSTVFGEIQYADIKPRIVCEPLLVDGADRLPIDYKLYCFSGKVNCVMVGLDRGADGEGAQHYFYDRNWERMLPYVRSTMHEERQLPRVESFDEMVKAAEILSRPFPFVRMDFYSINGRAVIGEMTFTPSGCIDTDFSELAQSELGQLITLPEPYQDG